MTRKPATTRDEMIEAAFALVRQEGHDALTARSLATKLGCSTQPIMYQFPSLRELRELVYQRADAFHTEYILATGDLLGIGLRYVQFAFEEPKLFRLLFQTGHFDGARLEDLVRAPQMQPLLNVLGPATDDDSDDAVERFEALYVAVHGYASLIANNAMIYDPEAVAKTLLTIGEALQRNEAQK